MSTVRGPPPVQVPSRKGKAVDLTLGSCSNLTSGSTRVKDSEPHKERSCEFKTKGAWGDRVLSNLPHRPGPNVVPLPLPASILITAAFVLLQQRARPLTLRDIRLPNKVSTQC